jgi:predicted cobalt transporter CbtA
MKAAVFVAITLISGAIAGTILGLINQGVVGPFIDRAIAIEMHSAAQNGEIINPIEFDAYRMWQRGGEVAAGTILGLSIGSLFGITFAYARGSLAGSSEKKKALMLAGIMWLVLFMVPALKYPANPPAVGDPATIYYRQSLYVAFLAISGLSALGLAFLYQKMRGAGAKRLAIPLTYAGIMVVAFVAMPPNPDQVSAPMDLVNGFRLASGLTMTVFWALLGLILGSFWDKLRPHETSRVKVA